MMKKHLSTDFFQSHRLEKGRPLAPLGERNALRLGVPTRRLTQAGMPLHDPGLSIISRAPDAKARSERPATMLPFSQEQAAQPAVAARVESPRFGQQKAVAIEKPGSFPMARTFETSRMGSQPPEISW